jgi:hypothetical protein
MFYFGTLSTDAHGLGGLRTYGYVMLLAPSLTSANVLSSLRSGDFVSVEEGCAASPVSVARPDWGQGAEYRVEVDGASEIRFVGHEGRTLARSTGGAGTYEISGDEGYVRAEAADSDGLRLFTQPVMDPSRGRI